MRGQRWLGAGALLAGVTVVGLVVGTAPDAVGGADRHVGIPSASTLRTPDDPANAQPWRP